MLAFQCFKHNLPDHLCHIGIDCQRNGKKHMHSIHFDVLIEKNLSIRWLLLRTLFFAPTLEGDDKILPLFHQTHNHQQSAPAQLSWKDAFLSCPLFCRLRLRTPSLLASISFRRSWGSRQNVAHFPREPAMSIIIIDFLRRRRNRPLVGVSYMPL